MSQQIYKVGYRRLLKSAKLAFANDKFAIGAAQQQLRVEFSKNKSVSDDITLKQLWKDVEDVDEMLRFHIVQGKMNSRGHFEVGINTPEHKVTLDAGQGDPHGPELTPIDPSFVGRNVSVTKSGGKR